jgi:hypothetical protein
MGVELLINRCEFGGEIMIDVKELIKRLTIHELIEPADQYFAHVDSMDILVTAGRTALFTKIGNSSGGNYWGSGHRDGHRNLMRPTESLQGV